MLAPYGVFAHRVDRGFATEVGFAGSPQNALACFSRGVVRINMNVNRLRPSLLASPPSHVRPTIVDKDAIDVANNSAPFCNLSCRWRHQSTTEDAKDRETKRVWVVVLFHSGCPSTTTAIVRSVWSLRNARWKIHTLLGRVPPMMKTYGHVRPKALDAAAPRLWNPHS